MYKLDYINTYIDASQCYFILHMTALFWKYFSQANTNVYAFTSLFTWKYEREGFARCPAVPGVLCNENPD